MAEKRLFFAQFSVFRLENLLIKCTKHRCLSLPSPTLSLPPPPFFLARDRRKFCLHFLPACVIVIEQLRCRCSSMAECQLPKLNTGVRFPSPAPHKKPAKALIFNTFAGFSFTHFPAVVPFQGTKAHFTGGGNHAPALPLSHSLAALRMARPMTASSCLVVWALGLAMVTPPRPSSTPVRIPASTACRMYSSAQPSAGALASLDS